MSEGRAPAGPQPVPVGIGWRHPHYAEVLAQRPALDFLEVHSENFFAEGGAAPGLLEQARALYPISLHGVGLSLGSAAGLDDWHLAQLARLVARVEPVRVSDHASFARGRLDGAWVHAADLLPLPFTDEALAVLCANVQRVQECLRRPMLVENLSAYVRWQLPPQAQEWPEPEFLGELARRTGCGLLLDVNNLMVNALNIQLQGEPGCPVQRCCDWVDALRPQDVGEIHLAGHCHVREESGEWVVDDHGSPVAEPVWQVYRHARARLGPAVPALVEWDTDVPALAVLLEQADLARGASGLA